MSKKQYNIWKEVAKDRTHNVPWKNAKISMNENVEGSAKYLVDHWYIYPEI